MSDYNCELCGCNTWSLTSRNGDPEGIRNDRRCVGCGTIYGMSKAAMFILERPPHNWRAGQWYTVRKDCQINMDTTTGGKMTFKTGDVLMYKGCRKVGDEFCRIFHFNGLEVRSYYRYIIDKLACNEPPLRRKEQR